MSNLLSYRITAVRLGGVCRQTVENLRHRGELTTVKIGRRRMVDEDSILKYLERQRQKDSGK